MTFTDFLQQSLRKPSSLRDQLLLQEIDDLNDFLMEFTPCTSGDRLATTMDDDPNNFVLVLQNFPLPNKYEPVDYTTMLLDISQYPQSPPNGLWLLPRTNPETVAYLQSYFSHTFENPGVSGEPVKKWKGYTWICFHYRDRTWDFNPQDFRSGDNLSKYVEAFFNALQDS